MFAFKHFILFAKEEGQNSYFYFVMEVLNVRTSVSLFILVLTQEGKLDIVISVISDVMYFYVCEDMTVTE